jgi:hypothetical protein
MKYITTLITIALIAIFTSCATFPIGTEADFRTAVRISTILYIGDSKEKADSALMIIQRVKEEVAKHEKVSISYVMEYVRSNVVWQELKPIEAVIVEGLLTKIELGIQEEIRNAQVPPDTKILVNKVIAWTEEAIFLSQLSIQEKLEEQTK